MEPNLITQFWASTGQSPCRTKKINSCMFFCFINRRDWIWGGSWDSGLGGWGLQHPQAPKAIHQGKHQRNHAKPIPTPYQLHAKSIPKPHRNHIKTIQNPYSRHSKTIPNPCLAWIWYGFAMSLIWVLHGFDMASVWF